MHDHCGKATAANTKFASPPEETNPRRRQPRHTREETGQYQLTKSQSIAARTVTMCADNLTRHADNIQNKRQHELPLQAVHVLRTAKGAPNALQPNQNDHRHKTTNYAHSIKHARAGNLKRQNKLLACNYKHELLWEVISMQNIYLIMALSRCSARARQIRQLVMH